MRVMITGGGTAGHTSPAVAIIEELQKRDPRLQLQWVGCRGSVEQRVCATLSIPFRKVPVRGWPRTGILRRLWALITLGFGVLHCVFLLRSFRPQVIIGVGGYVSVPLTWLAQRFGIATILHEQNKQLGLANRLLAPKAQKLLLSFPDTKGGYPEDRALVVGNPVRQGFLDPPERAAACAALELDPAIPVVLVCGGSQGAHTLNQAMEEALQHFGPEEAQFIWMTGKTEVTRARRTALRSKAAVTVHAFIDDMVTACSAATVMVSRAGASSTAEIASLGKPSILVPYPFATDNHQEVNAKAFEDAGAAVLILDSECTGPRLLEELRAMLADAPRLKRMGEAARTLAKPVAVETIVETIFSVSFEEAS
ncbi:MAG: undecaprenyldiphospho-muramoylpentapeptide beta-N-acetylglucosaminyltransferase [Candidatus Hydrogenedentes bacterium]|nr:undecaprenyldiphospho-muramoylpentapeptide beta-N-acetylglucosaminyltransferase [Candidatus Hydrogenedentota bacterium]